MADVTEPIAGSITDAEIERGLSQVGVPIKAKYPMHRAKPDTGAMIEFARGYGDDNPLFIDPTYASASRWRGLIAAPLYPIAVGLNETPALTDEAQKDRFRSLFRGVGKYYAGVRWEFYRPIQASDDLFYEPSLGALEVKESSRFAGGRSVLEVEQTFHVDRLGSPVALRQEDYISADRQGTKKANKYGDFKRHTYSAEELEAIEAAYDTEVPRGDDPRWWEEVTVGDSLGTVVKGPWVVGDLIAMHMGMGWEGYGYVYPLRYSYMNRKKIPAFYTKDAHGVWDSAQRLHWDDERARELGLPAPYDYGQMRSCWMSHLLTNWMGDDAWLWRFDNQIKGFNFLGDTHWLTGEVAAKRIEQDHDVVDLNLRATNQRGEITVSGSATVILPSRKNPSVVLPVPPDALRARGAAMVAEAAMRRRSGL